MRQWLIGFFFVLTPNFIGFLSNFFSGDVRRVYLAITLPPLAPPPWIFGIVWPILYSLMGLAAYSVYGTPPSDTRTKALVLYAIHLLFNFSWSIIFFRFEQYLGALIILLIILTLALLTARYFFALNKIAGLVMLPYLGWLLFALYLNLAIAFLN